MKLLHFALSVAAVLSTGACTQAPPAATPPDGSGSQQTPPAGDQKSDWAAILKIEEEAKALVKANGCTSDAQCRTAPVGSRGCGGPRYYLVYCSRSTDSVALFRKLAQVEAAERAYNAKYQVASTCEFRMAPTVGVTAGACQSR
jgi:hypothetical protein